MPDIKPITLADFLSDYESNFSSNLPYVHTTEANKFLNLLHEEEVKVRKCDTFSGEELSYFFYGRPAYRKFYEKPAEWQLPVALIFKSTCISSVKRVYPFDTGAFKSGRYPDYLTTLGISGYELSSVERAIDLIVEAFFGSDKAYFLHQPKTEDEIRTAKRLDVRHAQVRALCQMNTEMSKDDRAAAIEIQTSDGVKLSDQLLGVVLPRPYFEFKEIKDYLRSEGVVVKNYDIYAINTESYMGYIYSEVKKIYEKIGVM